MEEDCSRALSLCEIKKSCFEIQQPSTITGLYRGWTPTIALHPFRGLYLICATPASTHQMNGDHCEHRGGKSEVDSANASGTQALTFRGSSNPVVLGVADRGGNGRERGGKQSKAINIPVQISKLRRKLFFFFIANCTLFRVLGGWMGFLVGFFY